MLSSTSISALILGLGAFTATASPLKARAIGDVYGLDIITKDAAHADLDGSKVYFKNGSIYVGSIATDPAAELLQLSQVGDEGFTFTPEHALAGDGDLMPYIIDNTTAPVKLSGSFGTTEDAESTSGFQIAEGNNVFNKDGLTLFEACHTSDLADGVYEIYWQGGDSLPEGAECFHPIIFASVIPSPTTA